MCGEFYQLRPDRLPAGALHHRINRNLQERDAHLADLRRQAAEEDQIVRIGLLASGAAHELGTPLATRSFILGDWRRMPVFRKSPELTGEIAEMQAQLDRCKQIVSGILCHPARQVARARYALPCDFFDDAVLEWRQPVASDVGL